MRTVLLILSLCFFTTASFGQLPKKAMKKMGQNPVLFIDSTEVDMTAFQALFDTPNKYDKRQYNTINGANYRLY